MRRLRPLDRMGHRHPYDRLGLVANRPCLGLTQGFRRTREDYSTHPQEAKPVFVRPPQADARAPLSCSILNPSYRIECQDHAHRCTDAHPSWQPRRRNGTAQPQHPPGFRRSAHGQRFHWPSITLLPAREQVTPWRSCVLQWQVVACPRSASISVLAYSVLLHVLSLWWMWDKWRRLAHGCRFPFRPS